MVDRVFTIERLNWRRTAAGWLLLPGTDRVVDFADRRTAEANAREREWAVRRFINPFRCGGPFLHYQTSFDAAHLCDWFHEAGLEPPGVTAASADWAEVWTRYQGNWTPRQIAVAWQALDRVRFFRVTEGEPGLPLFLVSQPRFELDRLDLPRTTQSQYVGSIPYMLVRTRGTANALCHALLVDGVVGEGRLALPYANDSTWARVDPDLVSLFGLGRDEHFLPSQREQQAASDYAEHRTLELTALRPPTPGQTLFVVLRRHWIIEGLDGPGWCWTRTRKKSCGRAVAAFDTLVAADACVAGLELEARNTPSPFRFGPPHGWGSFDASTVWGILSDLAPMDFANLWTEYTAGDAIWIGWWDRVLPSLTEEQIAIAWSLFEWLRFYEVVEVEYRE